MNPFTYNDAPPSVEQENAERLKRIERMLEDQQKQARRPQEVERRRPGESYISYAERLEAARR